MANLQFNLVSSFLLETEGSINSAWIIIVVSLDGKIFKSTNGLSMIYGKFDLVATYKDVMKLTNVSIKVPDLRYMVVYKIGWLEKSIWLHCLLHRDSGLGECIILSTKVVNNGHLKEF